MQESQNLEEMNCRTLCKDAARAKIQELTEDGKTTCLFEACMNYDVYEFDCKTIEEFIEQLNKIGNRTHAAKFTLFDVVNETEYDITSLVRSYLK